MMEYSITEILLLFSILQFLILGVALFFVSRQNRHAITFLSIFLISKAICFSQTFIWKWGGHELILFHLDIITISFDFILGPALYFHIKKLTVNNIKYDFKFILHFIPSLIFLTGVSAYFFISYSSIEDSFSNIGYHPFFTIFKYLSAITYIHFVIYSVMSFMQISNYEKFLKNNYSDIHKSIYNWFQFLIFGFIIIWMLNIISMFAPENTFPQDILFFITVVSIFLFSNGLILFALKFAEVFQYKIESIKKKYQKTLLSNDEIKSYTVQLRKLMESEKVFKNRTLSLADLADKINVPQHCASQIINTAFGSNFYDYVNSYRVDEVKSLLDNQINQSKTILEIALDSGFNSKSVFNESFKKFTGMTPSAYRKKSSLKLSA